MSSSDQRENAEERGEDRLAAAIRERGAVYLLTVGPRPSVHVVAVRAALHGTILDVRGMGGTSLTNLGERSSVTLLWPPTTARGFALIVDGVADRHGTDGVRVRASKALLHRAAVTTDSAASTCASPECVRIPLTDLTG